MGNSKRYCLLILLFASFLYAKSQEKLSFQEVDRLSYELYEKQEWKTLKKFSSEAFDQGIDFYYLRMRCGIACYESGQYIKAADNFEKALAFNSNDPLALEYLFYCFVFLKQDASAYKAYENLPPNLKESLAEVIPARFHAEFSGGPIFSNQEKNYNELDIDGKDNIYGEADIAKGGYYLDAKLSWQLRKGTRLLAAYSLVSLEKEQQIKIQEFQDLDYQYPLAQQQFYLNASFPIGKKFTLVSALNMIFLNYSNISVRFDTLDFNYYLPVETNKSNSYIGYLYINKDFNIVKAGLFGSYANLSDETQFQAGINVLILPFQNLNFYLSTTLLDHNNEGENRLIIEQLIGGRILKPIWSEIKVTFGQMQNYYDNQAFVVYNFAGEMNFMGRAKLIGIVNPRLNITAEYVFLSKTGNYLFYQNNENNPQKPIPATGSENFNSQIVLLGINWKF